MFDKIFGIFRKRKQADISQEIPGDTGDDMFDIGDSEMGDDFDADTISLETGMSDAGFSGSSGGALESEPEYGAVDGDMESPMDLDSGYGDFGSDVDVVSGDEEPVTPLPEVDEPGEYVPPAPRRGVGGLKGILVIVALAIVGLAIGFFAVEPAIKVAKGLLTSGPTPEEQLELLQTENAAIEQQLAIYREVGTIDDILAVKEELKKRDEMNAEIQAIDTKISNQPAVEDRLDLLSEKLEETKKELLVQKGTLANVEKSAMQIEARNDYLVLTTESRLERIRSASLESEMLKARLEAERVENAESRAMLTREIQQGVLETALESFTSE